MKICEILFWSEVRNQKLCISQVQRLNWIKYKIFVSLYFNANWMKFHIFYFLNYHSSLKMKSSHREGNKKWESSMSDMQFLFALLWFKINLFLFIFILYCMIEYQGKLIIIVWIDLLWLVLNIEIGD